MKVNLFYVCVTPKDILFACRVST